MRLHLKVGDCDMEQHLKEVQIRPFVLLLLLKELINRRHGAFDDNIHAQRLKERMERAVAMRYPEQEPDAPDDEKQGTIPPFASRRIFAASEPNVRRRWRQR